MAIELHKIKSTDSKKTKKRVGRGNSSGKGTYSGRGLKGQRARSGGKSGTKMRGFKQSLQKIPKVRGFNSRQPKKETVSLSDLDKNFKDGELVTPYSLKSKGLISRPKNGVKILANGDLKKKIIIKGCLATKKAIELIEKSGSKIIF
ncbi:MAG: 50S ribosomal protein L15 [Candidatus Magasanikbacteria bacterium]|nr:50S ribosomal protein L15 [Candidatus Magasanikbacteria bacterium]